MAFMTVVLTFPVLLGYKEYAWGQIANPLGSVVYTRQTLLQRQLGL
jgi:hypothetical protein